MLSFLDFLPFSGVNSCVPACSRLSLQGSPAPPGPEAGSEARWGLFSSGARLLQDTASRTPAGQVGQVNLGQELGLP